MSSAVILKLKTLKGNGIIGKAMRHNRRAIQAELGASGNIDSTRSHLNETLTGLPTAKDVTQQAKDMISAAGIDKLRKNAVLGIEIVVSLPTTHAIDDRAFFHDCAAWAGKRFGGAQNLLSVDIHRDESSPHCHIIILPLLAGKLCASRMLGDRERFNAMRRDFQQSVADVYGLQLPSSLLPKGVLKTIGSAVIDALKSKSDPVLKSKVWDCVRDAIDKSPIDFAVMLGIEIKAPAKRMRTMEQIFTSKGKGAGFEKNPIGNLKAVDSTSLNKTSPIGIQPPTEQQTLCSVVFPQTNDHGQTETEQIQRVRDCDLDPSLYDSDTGEYAQTPVPPIKQRRAMADAWVNNSLKNKGVA
jgi:hypothetical protein